MIVMGASYGGMRALEALLPTLPPSFPMPLALALHRHRETEDLLSEVLQRYSALPVTEVLDKEPIEPGRLYVAPADYHVLVERTYFSLSIDEPLHHARPSIDVLFESAADAFGPEVIGVVLTGASQDGAEGAARIVARGGIVLVQDPATAESPVMPSAALKATQTNYVLTPDQIAHELIRLAESISRRGR